MLRRNDRHRQGTFNSTLDLLRSRDLDHLEEGWAGTFYREFFCRIDEALFAPLYSDEPSRPNVPVNVLVSWDVLKTGFGWTDEEMMEQFTYNVQVRRAMGLSDLGEGQFDIRTVYNHRRRVSEYQVQTGIDLMEKVFEQVTEEQLVHLGLKCRRLRMDSTMVSSNIRQLSRLHFLAEVIQRVHEMLSEPDQQRYRKEFEPYVKGTSGQFVYRVRSEEGKEHIQRLGELMRRLVGELASGYGDEPGYAIMKRVYEEHFVMEEGRPRARHGKEVPRGTLQSLADPEATYRKKAGRAYVGYVANVTETCDTGNPVQLIVKVQTEKNITEDPELMSEVIPELKERLDVREVYTDGGYDSEKTGRVVREAGIEHIQTALRGVKPKGLSLQDFPVEKSESGQLEKITCPQGQAVPIEAGKGTRHIAHFGECAGCPRALECPTKALKRKGARGLNFTTHDLEIACIRRRITQDPEPARKLRGPIEPTMASLKRVYPGGELPVRGLVRVRQVLTEAAAMVNIRRIARAMVAKKGRTEAKAILLAHARPLIHAALSFLRRLKSPTQAPIRLMTVPAR